jgi:hypothetical protein
MNWTREPLGQLELPLGRARRGTRHVRERIEVRIRQRVPHCRSHLRTLVVEDLVENVLDIDEVALIIHD